MLYEIENRLCFLAQYEIKQSVVYNYVGLTVFKIYIDIGVSGLFLMLEK